MDRRKKDTLRAGATAVGVATGLLVLASTAQTPDGYIHASFGGPLDVLSAFTSGNTTTSTTDVLAIGDGSNDASELAALLKGQIGPAARGVVPNSPYRVAYEAGAAPTDVTGPVVLSPVNLDPAAATAAPTRKDAAILPSKPVIDSQGKIDCTGAVSCRTDPTTNITTVTFPDGIIAVVQKVNDLTVVAYKTITDALPAEISALLPPVPTTAPPPLLAAVAPPTPVPTVVQAPPVVASTAPIATAPATQTSKPAIDPGPPAPSVDLDTTGSGPKVSVTTPPKDFSPGQGDTAGSTGPGSSIDVPAPKTPSLPTKVKDTIGGVVDSVKGAVGSVLGPGASSKPDTTPGGSSSSGQDSTTSDKSASDNSRSDSSNGS